MELFGLMVCGVCLGGWAVLVVVVFGFLLFVGYLGLCFRFGFGLGIAVVYIIGFGCAD